MTRDEILAAAAQIFSEKGFHATSMADIAQAVHLQKASLYHHISSKQELLVEMLDQALDLLIEQMESVMALPLPPDEKLRQAMTGYLTSLTEHRDLASVLLLEHRSLEPDYLSRHLPRRDRYERLWRDLIQEGIDQNIFCCSDPTMSARALLGVMNWTITWFKPGGPLSAQDIASQFTYLFLHGLMTSPRPNPYD
jgi:TetR/AcrR family transcriptional regulator, cholesterol catabolism regulator